MIIECNRIYILDFKGNIKNNKNNSESLKLKTFKKCKILVNDIKSSELIMPLLHSFNEARASCSLFIASEVDKKFVPFLLHTVPFLEL